MITRERLERTAYGRSLIAFLGKQRLLNVNFKGDSDDPSPSPTTPAKGGLNNADVVASQIEGQEDRHHLVLDIDHPAWLIPSTTPGHYHLYVEVPGGISNDDYGFLLGALVKAGVVQPGYAGASMARGFTCVRLPWIEKEK